MLFPNGASQRGFDESSPHHPSKLRRTDDFTVVTDKGSHLPIPMPKKENGGGGAGAWRKDREGFPGDHSPAKKLHSRGLPCGYSAPGLRGWGEGPPPGGGGPAGGSLANPTQGSVGAVLT